jgi:hypothetical protein
MINHITLPLFELFGCCGAFVGLCIGAQTLDQNSACPKESPREALGWFVSLPLIAGGGTYALTQVHWILGLLAFMSGLAIAGMCLHSRRPRPARQPVFLSVGVNYMRGESAAAKLTAARFAFKNAEFLDAYKRFALRDRRERNYGAGGMPLADLDLLRVALTRGHIVPFHILVLLVRGLSDTPNEPSVIVVQGAPSLRAILVSERQIDVPGVGAVNASSVLGVVQYRW